jgi:hypothetical protein
MVSVTTKGYVNVKKDGKDLIVVKRFALEAVV